MNRILHHLKHQRYIYITIVITFFKSKSQSLTLSCDEVSSIVMLEQQLQAWSQRYRTKDIDMLDTVQRRTTKIMPILRDISYEMHLPGCDLTTLETRKLRGYIEVLKILSGYENIDRIFYQLRGIEELEDMKLILYRWQSC